MIVGGCPKNIGLVVRVLVHLGRYRGREDAYFIETVSGRFFNQLRDDDGELKRGASARAVTDRHKLRPLLPGETDPGLEIDADKPKELVTQFD